VDRAGEVTDGLVPPPGLLGFDASATPSEVVGGVEPTGGGDIAAEAAQVDEDGPDLRSLGSPPLHPDADHAGRQPRPGEAKLATFPTLTSLVAVSGPLQREIRAWKLPDCGSGPSVRVWAAVGIPFGPQVIVGALGRPSLAAGVVLIATFSPHLRTGSGTPMGPETAEAALDSHRERRSGGLRMQTKPRDRRRRRGSRRSIQAVLATLLVALGVVTAAVPAGATIATIPDPVGDTNGTDPRGDIIGVGASLKDTVFVVTLQVRTPEPFTSHNWISNVTGVIWGLDVNADSVEDYTVYLMANSAGPQVGVKDGKGKTICTGIADYDEVFGYFAGFALSCLGSPASVQINAFMNYDNGASDTSDSAPSPTGWCCSVTQKPTPPPPPPPAPDPGGYWMLSSTGEVYAFGPAPNLGGQTVSGGVDIESSPSGSGYYILSERGEVFSKGDAPYHGNGALIPGERAVSLSVTSTAHGYWIFTNRGRVIALGAATHKGDMSGVPLNSPVLDSVATPSGQGYWMVASDGGIFAFGDAKFSGSMGSTPLNKPVISMAPDPDGSGYWLVASDGGIFAFDATFKGSMGGAALNKPVSGIVPGDGGYLMVGEDGGIFAFGDVAFHGSRGSNPPPSPVVAVTLRPRT
jgi:hypothetical protein